MSTLYYENFLCVVDYHSKFPVSKKTEDIPADSLIMTCTFFSVYGLPKKIMSNAGCNFISGKCKTFNKNLNIEQAVSLSE